MAARKLQQEIDKEIKIISLGIQAFDGIYDKLTASTNASQREKLEDNLKKEIKKLQRSRDKVKTWATSSEIKNKSPLTEQRKIIETRMETFKAVEKEMKTKAFSKEGLSAAAKLDPKEREKMEVSEFVSDMNDELSRQVEAHEAEIETLQAGMKKGKKDTSKADRTSELERIVEKHKDHGSKLEIILRGLENGSIDVDQVKEIQDDIKHYVENNQEVDFEENEYMYEGLNLDEEEEAWGIVKEDGDRLSSQDAQSIADDTPDHSESAAPSRPNVPAKSKSQPISEPQANGRRSSAQHAKSPLPALSTLHQSLPSSVANKTIPTDMKPAPLPTIPTGQPLKYASAAAAAAASDKSGVGIAPLPPPPGAQKAAEQASPEAVTAQPVETTQQSAKAVEQLPKQLTPAPKDEPAKASASESSTQQSSKAPSVKPSPQISHVAPSKASDIASSTVTDSSTTSTIKAPQPPSPDSGIAGIALSNGNTAQEDDEEEEESIYHLPTALTDLLDSFEETKQRSTMAQPFDVPLLNTSHHSFPTPTDTAKPSPYYPQTPYPYTPTHYPTTQLPIFSDPRLYSRIDTDSLFYAFYYRQGTYQQYLAAKALKSQSWRFHKQYQTWFQRHEEPKNITEEFEQGTYRFFDYESTWMNRRKADFKFAYKYLEDDL
ncbi:general negative regulator of transcription subunit 5 [Recurvomyces mirabilis]|uniref:General negative regulator of transcription subunit n=1 Tax=Recurvomyces mirabilis TaxID=574656 RepID=A0AAE0WW57_9PEZI|nr:general negative regulator of transcription subunit 5 [Recurvomyces mirabilis]KAK5161430.1 general negative regulator of transcription subunit 5 [Recurvomyces mirabilis]